MPRPERITFSTVDTVTRGLSLQQAASAFIGSAKFHGLYGNAPGDAQFVEL